MGGGNRGQRIDDAGQLRRLIDRPIILRREANTRAIGTAAHIAMAIGRGGSPGGFDHFGNAQPAGCNRRFGGRNIIIIAADRHRVLPNKLFLRHFRPQIARFRPHIAMQQFKPSAGKSIGQLVGVLMKALGNLAIIRVFNQRNIGRVHRQSNPFTGRVDFRCHIVGRDIDRMPNIRTGRRGGDLPVIFEQRIEIAIIPLCRIGGPRPLQTGRDGVAPMAGSVRRFPPKPHLLNRRGFRLRSDQPVISGPMHFAECVPTGHQRHGFLIIHRHAGKGFTDVLRRF